ncbi:uncharacterized protein MEPE_06345 [Melanopsichium pennsylvanicum]|uniref:HTH APSES-type domain-containing protein n=1 Tax=Melanopsichium pennsylvanicum TaxID=63383 RepID=A0AAJ4XRP5_9BASI|nr:uncharacterized protein MEPE_06345 [Melanopsichium pennsylvanicum]
MPMSHVYDSSLAANGGMARKRALPYARNELGVACPHPVQAPVGGNGSSGSFYISAPRPARLFPTQMHEFRKGKYATTGGDRGFMAVFEYDVRGHTMMINVDTSFVRFTSITQALGKTKVNFGRLIRNCPALDPHITKLKGGYLSIQGTWLPYDLAKELSRRIAWEIRDHLVPLFGYDFPASCLRPNSDGFGQLAIGASQKRALSSSSADSLIPVLNNSVVDGQTVEHMVKSKGGVQHSSYEQSQPATFHYSKFVGLERGEWNGTHEGGLGSTAMSTDFEHMMWPPASSMVGGGGEASLQVPEMGSERSTSHAHCASPIVRLEANGGSPILSSPPSSNASSSSLAQNYAAGCGLVVPPTVPSHASLCNDSSNKNQVGPASSCNNHNNHNSDFFQLDQSAVSPIKTVASVGGGGGVGVGGGGGCSGSGGVLGVDSRDCGGFTNAYTCSSYSTNANVHFSTWSESTANDNNTCKSSSNSNSHTWTYMSSSSPSLPASNIAHAPSSSSLESWQPSTVSN